VFTIEGAEDEPSRAGALRREPRRISEPDAVVIGRVHLWAWAGRRDALPRGMGCITPAYRPRDAEHTVLHQVIAEHLEAFLGAGAEAGDGAGLPQFVEREFREFLLCGVYEAGVARFQCEGCAREHLVPFRARGAGGVRAAGAGGWRSGRPT
jgi:hypothetical protein